MSGESYNINISHSASSWPDAKAAHRAPADYATWSPRLQCAYDICMQATLPMCICFADSARLLYNSAWAKLPGVAASSAGDAGDIIYGGQWATIHAAVARVIDSNATTQCDSTLFGSAHHGLHNGFFNYHLQPLALEDGAIIVLISAERSYEDVEKYHDEFLATIAHELRNPFGALAAAAQVLNKAIDRPQMMATARDALTRQVGHLAQLLDDLLDISRLRRGRLELRKQPVPVKDVLDASMTATTPVLESRQLSLVVDESDSGLRVIGDRQLLIKAFSSLLKYVAKHTGPGRSLQLQTTSHEAGVDIVIRNTGFVVETIQHIIGDCLERKFIRQPGKELDLGFYLVCGLVQLHGGEISAQRAQDNGTDLIVRLPRAHVLV